MHLAKKLLLRKEMLKTKLIMEVRALDHTNNQTTKPQDQERGHQVSIVIF